MTSDDRAETLKRAFEDQKAAQRYKGMDDVRESEKTATVRSETVQAMPLIRIAQGT